jgi:repressor LexA
MTNTSRPSLTERQEQILNVIRDFIADQGYPPSIRELGAIVGIRSTNGVSDHLKALERKGYLTRGDFKSRALIPVDATEPSFEPDLTDNVIRIPVLGKIAAGNPILAVESQDDSVYVDKFFLGNDDPVFGLRVTGESMIGDGIFDGDYIFVKKRSTARPGEIVVAMIDGEATVKRYFPDGNRIRFQPSNPTMEPIFVYARDFLPTQILGVVVGVYRRYN